MTPETPVKAIEVETTMEICIGIKSKIVIENGRERMLTRTRLVFRFHQGIFMLCLKVLE